MQAAIIRCVVTMAVGVVGAYPNALAPATAPGPSLLPPHQPFFPSKENIVVVRLFYGSVASIGDVELPLLAPVGPDAP